MKAEIKKLWVEALRSGDYTQTKYALHRPDEPSFCCLGVLCEIAYQQGVVKTKVASDGVVEFDGDAGVLPISVRAWADISTSNGVLPRGARFISLASANDQGVPFNEIARCIEEFL